MFIAIDENKQRILAEDAQKNKKYFCPTCGAEVRPRNGQIRIAHYAHISVEDCDPWASDMSEWHRAWQSKFPIECQEVVVTDTNSIHRADVKIGNTVVEFQHSRITFEEFWERNRFYNRQCMQVIWLFDLTQAVKEKKLLLAPLQYKAGCKVYEWKYSWKTFKDFLHKKYEGRISIFFQMDEEDKEDSIMQLLEYDDKKVAFDKQNKYSTATFVEACKSNLVDPAIFPPEDAVDLWKEKYTVGDLQDSRQSYKSNRTRSWGVDCPMTNRHTPFENCQACEYNGNCIVESPYSDKISKELRRKVEEIRKRTPSNKYFELCTYRFRDILSKWDIYHDRVLELDRIHSEVIAFNTTAGVFPIISEQAPPKAEQKALIKDETPMTIRELLNATGAKVIIVKNIRTGKKAKISSIQSKYGPIRGYLSSGDYEFSPVQREIYYATKSEWILEWTTPT